MTLGLRLLLLVSSLSLLVSCSQTLTPLERDSTKHEQTNRLTGFLLFAVQTDSYIKHVNISGILPLRYSPKSAEQGNAYVLAEVPVGYYAFSSVETGVFDIEANDEHLWGFDIDPGVINYVGNLELLSQVKWCDSCFRLELANKSSFALEYLELAHPELLERTQVVYKGPGQDSFIEFAMAMKAQNTLAKQTEQN
ncbi:hypothetical protein C2869_16800 [Saccharobesus litoralis]|uniref:DUF2846 domain-containing protein n=1 Tax=Saccharobesus litoralis TaxID=2172099 RepID=A0A2S0VUU1_9ALTE|nr:hypothetical protein [Saccharobesus litoralis]AWB67979.1 hypothetical protein C2869_16800 [Saccharobesus litoralis]